MSYLPLDVALWVSGGVFGLGLFLTVPIWWRNWRVRRGADLPVTEFDVNAQALARMLMLFGLMMALGTVLTAASRAMDFGPFMALCGFGCAVVLAIAFGVDAARARRHR